MQKDMNVLANKMVGKINVYQKSKEVTRKDPNGV